MWEIVKTVGIILFVIMGIVAICVVKVGANEYDDDSWYF